MAQRLWRRRHGLPLGLDRAGRRWRRRRRVKLRIAIVTIRRVSGNSRLLGLIGALRVHAQAQPSAPHCAAPRLRATALPQTQTQRPLKAQPMPRTREDRGKSPHPRFSGSGRSRARRGRAVTSREEPLGVGRAIAMVAEVAPEVRGEWLGRKLAQRMLPARARVCLCRAATCDVLACACVCAGRVTERACMCVLRASGSAGVLY
jgi:hypothetical protein